MEVGYIDGSIVGPEMGTKWILNGGVGWSGVERRWNLMLCWDTSTVFVFVPAFREK